MNENGDARHWLEDHTSEVRLCVAAPTLPAVFEEAGRAVAALSLGDAPLPLPNAETIAITVDSVDREALLVDFLNELVFRTEVDGKAYTEITITSLSDTHLVASLRGARSDALRPLIKAATLHDVQFREESHGFVVRVVLDI